MDDLALLCNLYGDGPATLKRLREAGCGTIEVLERIAPEELAEIVGTTPAAARRFLREARLLGERTGTRLLEEEETGAPLASREESSDSPRDEPRDETEREQESERDPEELGAPLPDEPARSPWRDPLLDRVLESWRERDAAGEELRVAAAPAQELGELAASGTPLRPDLLDGLDLDGCARLRRFGVDSLEDLLQARALDLSDAMEVGLTSIARLQFLARRHLEQRRISALEERGPILVPHRPPAPAAEPRGGPATLSSSASPSGSELLTGPHPWPDPHPPTAPSSTARSTTGSEAPRHKFSLAEIPVLSASPGIGEDVEEFARRLRGAAVTKSRSTADLREAGSAGPFA